MNTVHTCQMTLMLQYPEDEEEDAVTELSSIARPTYTGIRDRLTHNTHAHWTCLLPISHFDNSKDNVNGTQ